MPIQKLRQISCIHFCCTTDSDNGRKRVTRNRNFWSNLGLSPRYIATKIAISFDVLEVSRQGLALAQFGCYQTHREVWREFLATDFSVALVTEDDAFPIDQKELVSQIEKFTLESSKNSKKKLLQLGHVIFPAINPKKLFAGFFKYILMRRKRIQGYTENLSFGTHCYLINRDMAEFLATFEPNGILGLDVTLMALSRSELASDMDMKRLIYPVSLQERIDSSIPSHQEYKGRDIHKLTIREKLVCLGEI